MLYTGVLRLRKKTLALRQWRLTFVRRAVIARAQLTFYNAIGFMELAAIAALGQTSALLIVLVPILFFRECVGKCRWRALFVGFMDAILIVQRGIDSFNASAPFPIFAAFC